MLLTTVLACQVEAERGAQAVHIEYIEDGSLGEPILSIQDAIKAKSYLSPPVELTTNIGDAAKALSEAQHTITNARWVAHEHQACLSSNGRSVIMSPNHGFIQILGITSELFQS